MCKGIVMIRLILVTALVITMAAISGCAYIPTPEHSEEFGFLGQPAGMSGQVMISKDTINLLKPGKTTRTEVLLKFGNPTQRFQQDRFFVYSWERISGYFLWSFGMCTGGCEPTFKTHSLCLEFTQDNLLRRFKHLKAGLFKNMDELMSEWMEGKQVLPTNSKTLNVTSDETNKS